MTRRIGAALIVCLGGGCAGIVGLDAYSGERSTTGIPDGGLDAKTSDSTSSDSGHPDAIGAGDAADARPDARPSFCASVVLLAPFDGNPRTIDGGPNSSGGGNTTYAGGRFGQALSLDAGGGQIDYATSLPSNAQGALSLWVLGANGQWNGNKCTGTNTLFTMFDDGPTLECYSGGRQIYQQAAGQLFVTSSGWKDGEWNLVTFSWSPNGMLMTTNGTPTPSTNVLSAFQLRVLRVGDVGYPPNAAIDDVALFSQPLTREDADLIYNAGVPLGTLCGP